MEREASLDVTTTSYLNCNVADPDTSIMKMTTHTDAGSATVAAALSRKNRVLRVRVVEYVRFSAATAILGMADGSGG
jgi:hypothetical protein